jgi:hypothetical protein
MNEERADIDLGFVAKELGRAFVTATTHEDPTIRAKAERRVSKWWDVLEGISSGRLKVGSRQPTDYPAWVTLEVVRGGFATGSALASVDPSDTELRFFGERSASREELFNRALSVEGLQRLHSRLVAGTYRIRVPEEAALLFVAWLARKGDVAGATRIIREIAPWSSALKFLPVRTDEPLPDESLAWRIGAGEARRLLARRDDHRQVAAMNETLTVWNPLADEFAELWSGQLDSELIQTEFSDDWRARATALILKYHALAATHQRSGKHRKPKENLFILRQAAERAVAGEVLNNRELGLVVVALTSMAAKRGKPGSSALIELCRAQARVAARPTHASVARRVAPLLAEFDEEFGIPDAVERVSSAAGIPADQMPPSVVRVLGRCNAAPVDSLIAKGLVPSSEVLAGLSPHISAKAVAEAYDDRVLGRLVAFTYKAFRDRRSLLLLDLQHQVKFGELPWVSASAAHRKGDIGTESADAARRLASLALANFPHTITPNLLVQELDTLLRLQRESLPLVEELAADIFMGTFSAKFVAAARVAAEQLQGSLYDRYYDIDYKAVLAIDDLVAPRSGGARTSNQFDNLCKRRAGADEDGYSVARNGTVIEQAQILTTHNLAAIWGPLGAGYLLQDKVEDLARAAFEGACRSIAKVHNNTRTLGKVKDAAYAWRQMVFFASKMDAQGQRKFVAGLQRALETQPAPVIKGMTPVVAGLAAVIDGDAFNVNGLTENGGRRLTGWATNGHWMQQLVND